MLLHHPGDWNFESGTIILQQDVTMQQGPTLTQYCIILKEQCPKTVTTTIMQQSIR